VRVEVINIHDVCVGLQCGWSSGVEAACSDISEEEDEEEEQQRDSVDNTRAQHHGPTDSSVSSRHTSIDFDVDYLIPFGRSGIIQSYDTGLPTDDHG